MEVDQTELKLRPCGSNDSCPVILSDSSFSNFDSRVESCVHHEIGDLPLQDLKLKDKQSVDENWLLGEINMQNEPQSNARFPQLKEERDFALKEAVVPWSIQRGDLAHEERVLKTVNAILNKLTPKKFSYLEVQIIYSGITTPTILQGVVSLIFDKAVMEPRFCPMYAQLFCDMNKKLPLLTSNKPGYLKEETVKRILLDKCQEVFEGADRMRAEVRRMNAPEREDKEQLIKLRALGNICLIGELFKQKMLTERIIHCIVHQLLGPGDDKTCPEEEKIKGICQLFHTAGKIMDTSPKSQRFVDVYFNRLTEWASNYQLAPRLKFMVLDVLDLRSNDWVPKQEDPLVTEMDFLLKGSKDRFKWKLCINLGSRVESCGHLEIGDMPLQDLKLKDKKPVEEKWVLGETNMQNDRQSHARFSQLKEKGDSASVFTLKKAVVPWSIQRGDLPHKERVLKTVNAILNKMTPYTSKYFEVQIMYSGITTSIILEGVVSSIFNKAVLEPRFCPMYAKLLCNMNERLPSLTANEPGCVKEITVKKILLNKCQEAFEGAKWMRAEVRQMNAPEREDKEQLIKLRALGNICLIGELIKQRMIPEKIIHYILQEFSGPSDDKTCPEEENIEGICQLFRIIGSTMHNDPELERTYYTYFTRLTEWVSNSQLTPRLRFMVLDILDWLSNSWVPKQEDHLVTEMDFLLECPIDPHEWKPCIKFFSTRGCVFGDNCFFSHYIPGGYDSVTHLLRHEPSLHCQNYNTNGYCKFGDRCWRVHGEWPSVAPLYEDPRAEGPIPCLFGPHMQPPAQVPNTSISKLGK